jgi:triacylglycerol lipase
MPGVADRFPVLLVHGIWKSGAAFGRMARHLRDHGFEVHALDLVPNDGGAPIEELGAQVAAYIECHFPAGAPLDLVGFSMGGVVSRHYVQRLGGIERVRRLITISSPHHGTATAYLSRKPGGIQLRPNSAFLTELNRDVAMLERIDVSSIYTPLDLMILPARSSRLPLGYAVAVAAPLHALMLHDPRAMRAVTEALSAPLGSRSGREGRSRTS